MDALTLLRYWRTNAATDTTTTTTANPTTTTTIVTGVSSPTSNTEVDTNNNNNDNESDNDNGPFFDLEFSLPAEENEEEEEECDGSESSDESENESELKVTFMSNSSGDSTADVHVSVSPSDDLFFKGGFVPVDNTSETNSKPPQFRLSLMKSATKFRVMMLKFRKSKLNSSNASNTSTSSNASSNSNSNSNSKEEKQKSDRNSSKPSKNLQNENEPVSEPLTGSSEEKLFSKEMMEKCLRKVKPLYVAVSQKYGEKLKLKDSSSSTNPRREKQSTSSEVVKQGSNLPAGLRVVCKRFGKSLSASSAVVAGVPDATPSQRRDDSLIQQQDGIQSAILHCKRSFKASRDCDGSLSLVKSVSEPVTVAGEIEKS